MGGYRSREVAGGSKSSVRGAESGGLRLWSAEQPLWRAGGREFRFEHPLAAGIVNVTSDSFFSGARSHTPEQAVKDGLALATEGFEVLDIGAVAARSGPPVPADAEAEALIPVVEGLRAATDLPLSVDTFSAEVAARAIEAGAEIVNDISGGSPEMYALAAETGCGLVIMHIEGPPRTERDPRPYDDVVAHLLEFFTGRIQAAVESGVSAEQVAIDPGFDFDLTVDDNLELLGRLDELHALGRPLFVALSRKDFLGAVLAGSWEERLPPEDLEWATVGAVTIAVARGAQILRIHDVSSLDAIRVAHAICDPAYGG
jgi:dihydropteroate synthase